MKAKWLIVLIIFLIAVPFSGKAAYAAPADDALSALYQYYEICSNEDIEAYMDIMDFSGGEGFPEGYIENTRNLALAVWDNYDILSYELSNIEVSVDDEGEHALISYHIYQELRGADSEGNIKTATMDMDYVALMHDMEGWKVVYLMPRVAFEENMRNIAPIIAAANIIEHLAAEEESINRPPIASFYIMPQNPTPDDTIVGVGASSSDPDGDALTYSWYFNGEYDEYIGNLPNWTWPNPQAGEHTIKLVVDDGKGGSAEDSRKIKVGKISTENPGFEIALLIGAIVVALIVIKRRKYNL
jgi:hypothetical protein